MDGSFLNKTLGQALDYLEEGIQIIDNRGIIVYHNKFATALDDINRDEAIGRHILEVYPSLNYDTSTLLKALKSGKPILNTQQTFINYKGYRITTINSSIPIIDKGNIIGVVEISKDITHVKSLSEKIIDLQAQINNPKIKEQNQRALYTFMDIIGQSEKMLKIKSLALKASQSPSPLLIYGETGTGKELFVQSIHNSSPRRGKAFIAQNCAALPPTLLESILFGTVKGSFTGAENRPGLFELANKGTLFLDEINSMPLELQPKLLRVLQENYVRRVGDVKTIPVDVRVITALNKPPKESIEAKELREDLFYRLNVISLFIHPLRERREDLQSYIEYFIDKYNTSFNKQVKAVSPEVKKIFYNHNWPGNVRELKNTIEGAMNMVEGDTIALNHLPQSLLEGAANLKAIQGPRSLKQRMTDFERQAIVEAMERCNNNISRAAQDLKIPRQTLQYKLIKYHILQETI
jgi:arginine utilization regulatory protein